MPAVKKLMALSAVLLSLLLSTCVAHTHQRAPDMAQEYDAVLELDGAVYQAGNRFYVQGVRTKVRRSGYDVYDIPVLKDIGGAAERSGCYTVVAGAPQQTLYREFRMRYPWKKPFGVSDYAFDGGVCYSSEPPRDDAPVWNGGDWKKSGWHPYRNSRGEITSWYRYHIEDVREREYRVAWQMQLPPGARPVPLTAEQIAATPCRRRNTAKGGSSSMSAASLTPIPRALSMPIPWRVSCGWGSMSPPPCSVISPSPLCFRGCIPWISCHSMGLRYMNVCKYNVHPYKSLFPNRPCFSAVAACYCSASVLPCRA